MGLIISDNLRRAMKREKFKLEREVPNRNIDLNSIKNSHELLEKLLKTNSLAMNEARDKEAIKIFLLHMELNLGSPHYYFPNKNKNMDYSKACKYGDESGMQISGSKSAGRSSNMDNRGNWDYRITMRGSHFTTPEEALAFTDTLVQEANKRGLNIRMKDPWTHDAVILYINKDELLDVVRMLEDLKDESKFGSLVSQAIKHFGPTMAYSARVSDDSYYGISMAHSEGEYGEEGSRLKGSYGGNPRDTFGSYIEKMCLMPAYHELYNKYFGDISKISADEMYERVIRNHKKYMLGFPFAEEDLPLWMNRRNYQEFMEEKKKTNVSDDSYAFSSK